MRYSLLIALVVACGVAAGCSSTTWPLRQTANVDVAPEAGLGPAAGIASVSSDGSPGAGYASSGPQQVAARRPLGTRITPSYYGNSPSGCTSGCWR